MILLRTSLPILNGLLDSTFEATFEAMFDNPAPDSYLNMPTTPLTHSDVRHRLPFQYHQPTNPRSPQFFTSLTALFTILHKKDHGSVFLTQKPCTFYRSLSLYSFPHPLSRESPIARHRSLQSYHPAQYPTTSPPAPPPPPPSPPLY